MSKPLTRAQKIAEMLNPKDGVYKPKVTLVHAEQRPRSNYRTTKPLSLREKKKKEREKITKKQSSLKQKSENIPDAVRKPTPRLAKPGLTKYPRANSASYTSGLSQLVKTGTSPLLWSVTKERVSPRDMMRRTRRNRGGKRRKTRKKRKRRKTRKKKIKKRKRRKTRKRKRRGV